MADQFKFFVVDLYTDAGIEVAITSERWAIDKDETYYPSHIKGPKWEKMVRSHEAPTKTWATYPYKLRKICGTWPAAKQMEKRAFEDADSELNTEVDWSAGRKRKAQSVYSSSRQPAASAPRASISTATFRLRDPINVSDDDEADLIPISEILHHLNGSTVSALETPSQRPGASTRQAAASSQQHGASTRQAAASSQQHGASTRQAAASSQQSGAPKRQVAASSQRTGAPSKPQLETPSMFDGIIGFEAFDSSSGLGTDTLHTANDAVESRDANDAVESRDAINAVESRDAINAVESRDAIDAVESRDAIDAIESCDGNVAAKSSDANHAVESGDANHAVESGDANGTVESCDAISHIQDSVSHNWRFPIRGQPKAAQPGSSRLPVPTVRKPVVKKAAATSRTPQLLSPVKAFKELVIEDEEDGDGLSSDLALRSPTLSKKKDGSNQQATSTSSAIRSLLNGKVGPAIQSGTAASQAAPKSTATVAKTTEVAGRSNKLAPAEIAKAGTSTAVSVRSKAVTGSQSSKKPLVSVLGSAQSLKGEKINRITLRKVMEVDSKLDELIPSIKSILTFVETEHIIGLTCEEDIIGLPVSDEVNWVLLLDLLKIEKQRHILKKKLALLGGNSFQERISNLMSGMVTDDFVRENMTWAGTSGRLAFEGTAAFTLLCDAFRASIIYQGTENTLIEEGVKKWLWKATRRKLRGDEKKKKNEKLRLLKKGEKENIGEGGAQNEQAEGGGTADDAGGSDIEAAVDGIIELAGGNIDDIEDF